MWGGGGGGRTKAPEQKSTVVKSFDELHSTPYPLIFLCAYYCLFVYSNLEIFHIAVWIDQEWEDAVFLQYVLNLFEIISAKKHELNFLPGETNLPFFCV